MVNANEAAQKIAAATVDVRQAKMAQPSRGNCEKLKTAERRLATLLTLFVGFKNDPRFNAAYRREMSTLGEQS
jgi:hypothetical protein